MTFWVLWEVFAIAGCAIPVLVVCLGPRGRTGFDVAGTGLTERLPTLKLPTLKPPALKPPTLRPPTLRLAGIRLPLVLAVGLVLCAAASFAITTDHTILLFAAVVLIAAMALGITNWRWSVLGVLLFIPFSGIPTIVTYPHTQWAVLLKDLFFVIPAYCGFALARRRQGWSFQGAPLIPMFGFVALVFVQSYFQFRTPLVALVGIKVWVLYIPLLFLGYHLVETVSRLGHVLWIMSVAAVVPLAIGIIEAILLDSGHGDVVYPWYGPAAAATTQQFAEVGSAIGPRLLRVPSTFTFLSQYYDFASAMIIVTFAWWRLSRRRWGSLLFGLAIVASFTSGARSAFVMTPLLVAIVVLLDGNYRQGLVAVVTLGLGVAAAVNMIGVSATGALSTSISLGMGEFNGGFVGGIPAALRLTLVGLGTGSATGASRYVLDASSSAPLYDPFSESWWVKAIVELGLVGLAMLVLLLGALLVSAYRRHRSIVDRGLKAVSASLLALLVWCLVYATKGVEIDLDPLNVYFWLFAGMLLRLRSLQAAAPPEIRAESTPSRSSLRHRREPAEAAG